MLYILCMDTKQEFQLAVAYILLKTGWSKRELARQADCDHTTILSAGKHKPHTKTLEAIRGIRDELQAS